MTETYLHLVFNHIAILGVVFSCLLALCGLVFHSVDLKKAALAGVLFSSLATAIVFKTGEGAEESVEHLQGISESSIQVHEEAADVALWLTLAAGVVSAVVLYLTFKRKALPGNLFLVFVATGLLACCFLVRTGLLGGRIHHTEIGTSTGHAVESTEEAEVD